MQKINLRSRVISAALPLLLMIFATGPAALAANAGLGGNTAIDYTEGSSPVNVLPDITISGGPFDGQYIDFQVDPTGVNSDNQEDLGFSEVGGLAEVDTTLGAISIYDDKIFLGDGESFGQIGQISSTFDGLDGTKLRVEFVSSFSNSGFESAPDDGTNYLSSGTLAGWGVRGGQFRLGLDYITIEGQNYTIPDPTAGYTTNYAKGCNPTTDDDLADPLSTWVEIKSGTENVFGTVYNLFSEGGQSLQLRSSGTSAGGGDIVHGPVVWSEAFSAETGQVLYFDWAAFAGGDNYHIWAGLLNVTDNKWVEILDETGNSDKSAVDWSTENITIPEADSYRFVFVSGTQDWTCYQGIGARLLIDNVRVVGSKATADAVQTLARKLTYFNDGDGPDATQTLQVTAKPTSGTTAIQDHIIRLTGVNDAPSIDGDGSTTAVAATVVETDVSSVASPISDLTGTLAGYDPDMDSPTYEFGISGETPSSGTVSKAGTYGTLTVNTSTGAYTYAPNMAAIKPLNTGDDPVDSFALTVSDGALAGSGTLNVTIDSFTDTEPSAPTITAVIAGDQHLSVLFDPPASEGGNSITDYEYSTDGTNYESLGTVPTGGFAITALSSDGTSPLVNGTSYPITIRATNGQLSPVSNSVAGTPNGTPSINSPSIQSFEPSASLTEIDNDFVVSGFAASDNLLVSIGLSNNASGTKIALANFEDSGASEGSGYSSYTDGTAMTDFAITGSQTQVNAALAGMKIQTGSDRSNFSVNVSASIVSGSVVQSGSTQSFYEYVSDSRITFDEAVAAAAEKTFAGVNGYLVTITSAAENAFVKDRINGATNVWIGASDADVEGTWEWISGPEGANGGTVFFEEGPTQLATDDETVTYASWATNEPNDASGEDAAVTNWGSATGTWNDLRGTNSSSVNGYVVEYSEWNGQTFSAANVVKTSTAVSMGGPVLTGSAGALSASLSWTTPSRSGETVSSYAVTAVPSVSGQSTVCSGAVTSCTVTGLTAGTTYSFTVTATWSDAATSGSNPVAVTASSATSSGGTSSKPKTVIPLVTPPTVLLPRFTTPTQPTVPGVQSGPVLTRGVVPSPPKAPTVLLGGRPTVMSTTVPTTTQLDVKAGRLSLGVKVLEDQGTISEAPDGTTEIAVRKGASATISGSGFKPAATVQVFLPLDGDNAKELTRIPVNADGSFDGSAPFATRPNEAPLPVGKNVLQLVSLDTDGNQVVVEMTVNIAQGAPSPETNRIEGVIPTMTPGQSIATSGGEPVPVRITPVAEQKLAVVEGDGWSMAVNVNAADGGVEPAEGGALLKLVRNETAVVSGSGFMPGTRADVWLFSDPTLLGTVTIDENGEFTGEVNIDPNMIPVGQHTLQLQGVGEDGYVKAANMGVVVDDAAAVAPTTMEQSLNFIWWIALLVILVALTVVVLVSRRRRQA